MSNFGEMLKFIRKHEGITQKKLSELTGIAEVTIREYEANKYKPKFDKIQLIAKALNVPVYSFVKLEEETDEQIKKYMYNEIEEALEASEQSAINLMKSQKVYDISQRIKKVGFPICIASTFDTNHNYQIFINEDNNFGSYIEVTDEELLALEKDSNDYLKFKLTELIKQKNPKLK